MPPTASKLQDKVAELVDEVIPIEDIMLEEEPERKSNVKAQPDCSPKVEDESSLPKEAKPETEPNPESEFSPIDIPRSDSTTLPEDDSQPIVSPAVSMELRSPLHEHDFQSSGPLCPCGECHYFPSACRTEEKAPSAVSADADISALNDIESIRNSKNEAVEAITYESRRSSDGEQVDETPLGDNRDLDLRMKSSGLSVEDPRRIALERVGGLVEGFVGTLDEEQVIEEILDEPVGNSIEKLFEKLGGENECRGYAEDDISNQLHDAAENDDCRCSSCGKEIFKCPACNQEIATPFQVTGCYGVPETPISEDEEVIGEKVEEEREVRKEDGGRDEAGDDDNVIDYHRNLTYTSKSTDIEESGENSDARQSTERKERSDDGSKADDVTQIYGEFEPIITKCYRTSSPTSSQLAFFSSPDVIYSTDTSTPVRVPAIPSVVWWSGFPSPAVALSSFLSAKATIERFESIISGTESFPAPEFQVNSVGMVPSSFVPRVRKGLGDIYGEVFGEIFDWMTEKDVERLVQQTLEWAWLEKGKIAGKKQGLSEEDVARMLELEGKV